MAASTVAEPIGNILQRNYHNGANSYNNGGANSYNNGSLSYDGRGLMRGGSSAPITTTSNLESSLQMTPQKIQTGNSSVRFDSPMRYVGNSGFGYNKDQLGKDYEQANVSPVSVAKPKIIVLNKQGQIDGEGCDKEGNKCDEANTIPKPKIIFFSPSGITVSYSQQRSAGAGMYNMGNTCYLNSTLQALFHTPALYNYLIESNAHTSKCTGSQGISFSQNCILCAMSHTLRDTLRSNVIKPNKVYEKLKSICKHMVHGRQEDAHEFLRYLIESLQRSYLISERAQLKTLDNASKETTPFNQIFGGYMRQDVTCLRCKYVSTTFQHFMDLLLDIRQVSTIEDALQHHFRQERIGGNGENADSMYKCEKCHVKVPAKKQSLIERPPAVLCIQLKRFSLLGGKISKPVQLSRMINMKQYINTSGQGASTSDVNYKLVSMITHVGPSPNCGHYTAIGEAANGQFFQFDDSSVRPISIGQVMNTASYVVFYEMTKASWDRRLNISAGTTTIPPTSSNGSKPAPHIAPRIIPPTSSQNGISSIKPKLISTFSSHAVPVINRIGVVATTLKRNIINVTTATTSKPITNGPLISAPALIGGLVPYDDDSDSDTSLIKTATKAVLPNAKPTTEALSASVMSTQAISPNEKTDPVLPKPAVVQAAKSTASSFSFVPRSVTVNVLKKSQSEYEPVLPATTIDATLATRKSSSGTWLVTDLDVHTPSIASDGSWGSTTSNWVVTPAKAAASHTPDAPRVTSPLTVTQLVKTSPQNGDEKRSWSQEIVKEGSVFERLQFPVTSSRKRGSVDDSDADYDNGELDRGRTKKVKKSVTALSSNYSTHDSQNNRSNLFQSGRKQVYHNQGSDHSGHERHQSRPWNHSYNSHSHGRYHDDDYSQHRSESSRSRSNSSSFSHQDRYRRKSFGGNDHRDSHHHKYNSHNRSSDGSNRNYTSRRDDYSNRNGFRHHRR